MASVGLAVKRRPNIVPIPPRVRSAGVAADMGSVSDDAVCVAAVCIASSWALLDLVKLRFGVTGSVFVAVRVEESSVARGAGPVVSISTEDPELLSDDAGVRRRCSCATSRICV